MFQTFIIFRGSYVLELSVYHLFSRWDKIYRKTGFSKFKFSTIFEISVFLCIFIWTFVVKKIGFWFCCYPCNHNYGFDWYVPRARRHTKAFRSKHFQTYTKWPRFISQFEILKTSDTQKLFSLIPLNVLRKFVTWRNTIFDPLEPTSDSESESELLSTQFRIQSLLPLQSTLSFASDLAGVSKVGFWSI